MGKRIGNSNGKENREKQWGKRIGKRGLGTQIRG